ncbi:hypothetical protein GGI04_001514 [Coemansia thaxteri]|uniref:Cytokinin riboside 5'-monophosphate phosphoribohydrolase n=1 Tax=Coemansia thaxteri TaxID=2663907 RepID=A0A9W8EGR3_9FUNG|nr:hypothetical protein H4R26_005295 [Coemansia thaxteri]KAJ2007423.1 hypothetical protein GGI04_001514 [Coemansia thaxteri]
MTSGSDNLVCVFCASSDSKHEVHNEMASELGRELARSGYGLVYGGGGRGLMGRVARGVAENNGAVVGIIPRALTTIEGFSDIGRTILVETMHERKQLMNEYAEAFISLPGGLGTLEELLEIATWSRLGIHSKPIVVLNTNGYYDALSQMIDTAIDAGFIPEGSRNIFVMCDTPKQAVDMLKSYTVPKGRYELGWSTALSA